MGGLRIGGSPGGGGRNREKRRLVVCVGVLLGLVVVWTLAVFILGVGAGGGGAVGGPPDGNAGRGAGSATAGSGVPAGKRGSTAAEPEARGPDYATPEHPETFMKRERARDRRAQGEPAVTPGGATDEPAGYDPLGISGKSVPLTPADQERVRAAAAEFVTAAYGYSGERGSREWYIHGVNDAVLSPEFYSSEGADEVRRYSDLVRNSGTKSAARMERFDVETAGTDAVVGYAYFATGDSYDRYGNLTGDEESYRQKLSLVRYGAIFKVRAADGVQEVRER